MTAAVPIDLDDVAAALAAALRRGGAWSEVFAEHRTSATSRLQDGRLELRGDRDVGAAVRVGGAGPRGSASTTVLDRDSLLAAAGAAAAVRDGRRPGAVLRPGAGSPPVPAEGGVDVALHPEWLGRCADAARSAGPGIRSVIVTIVQVAQSVLVATSEGRLTGDTRVRTRITCRVTARRSGRTSTGFEGPGWGDLTLPGHATPEAVGAAAGHRALRVPDAAPPPAGVLPVVLGPGGGGLLVHEACGHGLEADGVARGASVYSRTEGRRLASPRVTVVDDPTLLQGFGSYRVDDEGTPAQPTVLIDDGVQVAALTDRSAAEQLSRAGTPNGRRESAATPPLCRMSNTALRAGTDDPAAVLADLRRGVYLTRLSGGEVDVASGEFAFTASEAFLVEHGELTRPLTGVTLLGTGPAALAGITAVGDDLAWTAALCGNDGQWVPVSYGSPTLRIEGLTITGSRS
ncbi:TldD/PmbA family protein [Geodermatophilus amargosae]|uniref:TldD/PmbA family protein n=1 Tax=Geodermatophilus amargosae TaxID=1296565 RepID=UPI0034DDECCC